MENRKQLQSDRLYFELNDGTGGVRLNILVPLLLDLIGRVETLELANERSFTPIESNENG